MVFKKGESGSEEYKFKPGESGNPNGRPVGRKSFKTIIQEIAEQNIDYKDLKNKKISIKAGEALIISLFAKAIYKKDSQAAKILMEHAEAKKLEIGTDPEKPIEIKGEIEVKVFKEIVKETLEEF